MKRTKLTLFCLFFFACIVTSFQVNAQSFEPATVQQLDVKTGNSNVVFVSVDDAKAILLAEQPVVQSQIQAAAPNGGSAEATVGLRARFYAAIYHQLDAGESVEGAITHGYGVLLSDSANIGVPVNINSLVDDVITLLSA